MPFLPLGFSTSLIQRRPLAQVAPFLPSLTPLGHPFQPLGQPFQQLQPPQSLSPFVQTALEAAESIRNDWMFVEASFSNWDFGVTEADTNRPSENFAEAVQNSEFSDQTPLLQTLVEESAQSSAIPQTSIDFHPNSLSAQPLTESAIDNLKSAVLPELIASPEGNSVPTEQQFNLPAKSRDSGSTDPSNSVVQLNPLNPLGALPPLAQAADFLTVQLPQEGPLSPLTPPISSTVPALQTNLQRPLESFNEPLTLADSETVPARTEILSSQETPPDSSIDSTVIPFENSDRSVQTQPPQVHSVDSDAEQSIPSIAPPNESDLRQTAEVVEQVAQHPEPLSQPETASTELLSAADLPAPVIQTAAVDQSHSPAAELQSSSSQNDAGNLSLETAPIPFAASQPASTEQPLDNRSQAGDIPASSSPIERELSIIQEQDVEVSPRSQQVTTPNLPVPAVQLAPTSDLPAAPFTSSEESLSVAHQSNAVIESGLSDQLDQLSFQTVVSEDRIAQKPEDKIIESIANPLPATASFTTFPYETAAKEPIPPEFDPGIIPQAIEHQESHPAIEPQVVQSPAEQERLQRSVVFSGTQQQISTEDSLVNAADRLDETSNNQTSDNSYTEDDKAQTQHKIPLLEPLGNSQPLVQSSDLWISLLQREVDSADSGWSSPESPSVAEVNETIMPIANQFIESPESVSSSADIPDSWSDITELLDNSLTVPTTPEIFLSPLNPIDFTQPLNPTSDHLSSAEESDKSMSALSDFAHHAEANNGFLSGGINRATAQSDDSDSSSGLTQLLNPLLGNGSSISEERPTVAEPAFPNELNTVTLTSPAIQAAPLRNPNPSASSTSIDDQQMEQIAQQIYSLMRLHLDLDLERGHNRAIGYSTWSFVSATNSNNLTQSKSAIEGTNFKYEGIVLDQEIQELTYRIYASVRDQVEVECERRGRSYTGCLS